MYTYFTRIRGLSGALQGYVVVHLNGCQRVFLTIFLFDRLKTKQNIKIPDRSLPVYCQHYLFFLDRCGCLHVGFEAVSPSTYSDHSPLVKFPWLPCSYCYSIARLNFCIVFIFQMSTDPKIGWS